MALLVCVCVCVSSPTRTVQDVNDPDRVAIPEVHLAYYYSPLARPTDRSIDRGWHMLESEEGTPRKKVRRSLGVLISWEGKSLRQFGKMLERLK